MPGGDIQIDRNMGLIKILITVSWEEKYVSAISRAISPRFLGNKTKLSMRESVERRHSREIVSRVTSETRG